MLERSAPLDGVQKARMKAILCPRYGPPEVLELMEVEKPAPNYDEVLVKVYAASVNPLDFHVMRGEPFFARFMTGLRKPKDPRFGTDVAGRVEAVGGGVTQFKPGDEVFGACSGAFAEYAVASEKKLGLKSGNISFEQAAALPVAGVPALQALRNGGKIKAGQNVLVNGASGGVGTFAVQIARSYGTEVTGVCSTRNLDLVRSIGADHVIDYTQEDFTRSGRRYDLICDAIGNRSISDYKRALKPNGICVILGLTNFLHLLEHSVLGRLGSMMGNKKVGFMVGNMNSKDLNFLRELLEKGKVVPVMERSYSLGETSEAIRFLETRRARGKVIINVHSHNAESVARGFV